MDLETGMTDAKVEDMVEDINATASGSESESESEDEEESDSSRRRLSSEGTEDRGGDSTAVDDSVTEGSGGTACTLALGTITKSPTFALRLLVCTGSLAGSCSK